jgi:hypothetical protein
MINVAAIRMQQFGVQFYQASLTASDIDKLVRFEVLNYGDTAQPGVRGGKQKPGPGTTPSKVRDRFVSMVYDARATIDRVKPRSGANVNGARRSVTTSPA